MHILDFTHNTDRMIAMEVSNKASESPLMPVSFDSITGCPFGTILADPPWRFMNRTGKVAPEHRRLSRYDTMDWKDIAALPVGDLMTDNAHCYLWVPNALVSEGLAVLEAWGFTYKSMLVWYKIRKDGGPDGRGVGFYFRNVTEPVLFGVRGRLRTLAPGRRQVNLIATHKREHSRKPEEIYPVIEACSPGPFLELFARYPRQGWTSWGDEISQNTMPRGLPSKGYGIRIDHNWDRSDGLHLWYYLLLPKLPKYHPYPIYSHS